MRRAFAGLFAWSIAVQALAQSPTATAGSLRAWRERHEAQILEELRVFLAIPNVASDRENIGRNAEFISGMLRKRGMTTRLLEVTGAPPAVFAELRTPGAKRTLIFYAHYDGQPVDPAQWEGSPWTPALRDKPLEDGGKMIAFPAPGERANAESRIYARSASDDKSPIVALVAALDALRASGKRPSINIKFFFEGEEEAGSPHLREILTRNTELLRGDLWILCDGPVHQSRAMQVFFGARGVMGLEMTVYGPRRVLHSGHYGNWAPNAISILAELIVGLRSSNGRILIDGFYDDVRPLTSAERRALATVPPAEAGLLDEMAIGRPESEMSLPERIMLPAMNFRGVQSGSVGDKAANAIPTTARVSIDFRLVPDQTPQRVRTLVESHLTGHGYQVVHEEPSLAQRRKHPRLVRLQWEGGYPAARTPLDHPLSTTLVRAIESATSRSVIRMPTLGGSIPMYLFQEVLNTPVIGVPTVNHDNNQHAANENLRLQNLWDAIEVFAAIMTKFSTF